jgi:hypothetical protein
MILSQSPLAVRSFHHLLQSYPLLHEEGTDVRVRVRPDVAQLEHAGRKLKLLQRVIRSP